jgi:hypothetical protein
MYMCDLGKDAHHIITMHVQGISFNLLRSHLIKGLALPLVGIKYPTISTNLLKHLNRKKVK